MAVNTLKPKGTFRILIITSYEVLEISYVNEVANLLLVFEDNTISLLGKSKMAIYITCRQTQCDRMKYERNVTYCVCGRRLPRMFSVCHMSDSDSLLVCSEEMGCEDRSNCLVRPSPRGK